MEGFELIKRLYKERNNYLKIASWYACTHYTDGDLTWTLLNSQSKGLQTDF